MSQTKRILEGQALSTFRAEAEATKQTMIKAELVEPPKQKYEVEFDINDLPMQCKLCFLGTNSKLEEINDFSGAVCAVKGKYYTEQEKSNLPPGEKPLTVHIQGLNRQSVILAVQMIEKFVNEAVVPEDDSSPAVTVVTEDSSSKRPKMTEVERKEALKAQLEEKGIAWDESKFGNSKKERERRKKAEARKKASETSSNTDTIAVSETCTSTLKRGRDDDSTPPSEVIDRKKQRCNELEATVTSVRVSHKTIIKVAVVISGYPDTRLTSEQGALIENALMMRLWRLPDGSTPCFAGTYIERHALIIMCLNHSTATWLKQVIPELRPLGDHVSLVAGSKREILHGTKVLFRAPSKLVGLTPGETCDLLHNQNPTLRVKHWTRISVKDGPKNRVFIFRVDLLSLKALQACNYNVHIGLWKSTVQTFPGK